MLGTRLPYHFPILQDTGLAYNSMAPSLDNFGWFYRARIVQATEMHTFSLDHKISYYVLATFALVGFLAVFARIALLVRLFFSLFVLPGKPVCLDPTSDSNP